MEVIWIVSLRREPNKFKAQHIRIVRHLERRNLLLIRIPNVKCLRLRDNHAVASVEYILCNAIMPSLDDPILGDVHVLLLVS